MHPSQQTLLRRLDRIADPQRRVSVTDLCQELALSRRSMTDRLVRLTAYGVIEPSRRGDDSTWTLTDKGTAVARGNPKGPLTF
jgi:DNA-binding transcriptional regulator PaaX